jgi:hypothetical protein
MIGIRLLSDVKLSLPFLTSYQPEAAFIPCIKVLLHMATSLLEKDHYTITEVTFAILYYLRSKSQVIAPAHTKAEGTRQQHEYWQEGSQESS